LPRVFTGRCSSHEAEWGSNFDLIRVKSREQPNETKKSSCIFLALKMFANAESVTPVVGSRECVRAGGEDNCYADMNLLK
jgi:hypothetical protein